jgi:WD40-like Beta Propeller Repeat
MQRSRFYPALLTVPALLAASAGAAPTGQLVFIKSDAVYVAQAAGGPARRLPGSDHAWYVAASPTSGTVLYFVAPAGAKWDEAADTRGFVSRPPYDGARPLPPPLDHLDTPEVRWAANGRIAFWSAGDRHGTYEPASDRVRRVRSGADSASRDGRVLAFATDREIKVRWPASGKERTLFSIGRPQPLFAALRRARHPEKLRRLIDEVRPALWRQSRNWQLGRPALTPDGKTVFFAANAGSGMDDAGSSAFCFFAADVATGKLSVLSRLGILLGRSPRQCQVSPDGQRLFFVMPSKISAREEWRHAYLVDLRTQDPREILHADPNHAAQMSLMDGACWSPDGRYLAIAVLYYDRQTAFARAAWEPRAEEFVLRIEEAATGRTVCQIPGARQPSWSP